VPLIEDTHPAGADEDGAMAEVTAPGMGEARTVEAKANKANVERILLLLDNNELSSVEQGFFSCSGRV